MKKINLLIAGVLTLGLVACGTEETEVQTKKRNEESRRTIMPRTRKIQ
ncbi:ABC transporter substrate-binding protein [Bacillus nitratireducens]|nr:ABC transporter substrate-binding protein [Bacillus nitratireducens]